MSFTITFKKPDDALGPMVKALVRARKVGGSIVVSIPKEVVQEEGITEGELVELDVHKATKDWFGAFPKLRPFSREEELDSRD